MDKDNLKSHDDIIWENVPYEEKVSFAKDFTDFLIKKYQKEIDDEGMNHD